MPVRHTWMGQAAPWCWTHTGYRKFAVIDCVVFCFFVFFFAVVVIHCFSESMIPLPSCLPACEAPEPPSQVFVQAPGGTVAYSTCFDTAVDSRRG